MHKGRSRDGVALRSLPSLVEPASRGVVPADNLRSLSMCMAKHPLLAARDEHVLVPYAVELDSRDHRVATNRWMSNAEDVSDQPEPVEEPVSELFLSETSDGVHHLDATLVGEDGATVAAALQSIVDPLLRAARDNDPSVAARPASVLRAMALVDLCANALRREPSATSVPDRYRVALVIPLDVAERERPVVGTCDASMYRAVLDANSEPLDIGRTTQRWSTGIRRAVTLRDGGCVFPGCDRPPAWTDIHHCHHWEHGGETSVDNGALLCRLHHTFIHKQRWTVTMDHERPCVRRPDGSPHVVTLWQDDGIPSRPGADPPGTAAPPAPGHDDEPPSVEDPEDRDRPGKAAPDG